MSRDKLNRYGGDKEKRKINNKMLSMSKMNILATVFLIALEGK